MKNSRLIDIFLLLISMSVFQLYNQAQAMGPEHSHLLTVGLGIASPSLTTTLRAQENPVGLIYPSSFRFTLHGDHNDEITGHKGYGASLGYGSGFWGLAVESHTYDTTDQAIEPPVSTRFGAAAHVTSLNFALGVASYSSSGSVELSAQKIGLIFNPDGEHRLGLVYYTDDVTPTPNKYYGLGYAFTTSDFTLAIDAESYPDAEITRLAPGVMYHAEGFQLMLTQVIVNDDPDVIEDKTVFGLGLNSGTTWSFGVYSNLINDVSLHGSLYF